MDALAAADDAAVQMVDTSVIRVHQHGACIRLWLRAYETNDLNAN